MSGVGHVPTLFFEGDTSMPRILFQTRIKRIMNHWLYHHLRESVRTRFSLIKDELSFTSAGCVAGVTPERIKQQTTAAWSRLKRLERRHRREDGC